LIRRKRNPGKDMWSLPGGIGSLEKETNLDLAIKKEVESDFSAEYLNYNLFAIRTRKTPEPTIYLYYEGGIKGEPKIKGINTIKEIQWFNIKDVLKLQLAFENIDKEIVRLLRKKNGANRKT